MLKIQLIEDRMHELENVQDPYKCPTVDPKLARLDKKVCVYMITN